MGTTHPVLLSYIFKCIFFTGRYLLPVGRVLTGSLRDGELLLIINYLHSLDPLTLLV